MMKCFTLKLLINILDLVNSDHNAAAVAAAAAAKFTTTVAADDDDEWIITIQKIKINK